MANSILLASLIMILTFVQDQNIHPSVTASETQGKNKEYNQVLGLGLYKLYDTPMTWGQAWERCRNDGGHLLVIDSERELEVATDLIKKNTDAYYSYVGIHDLLRNKHFITVKDNDFQRSDYNKIAKEKQRVGHVDHCMGLTSFGVLHILECNLLYPFICEIEQGKE